MSTNVFSERSQNLAAIDEAGSANFRAMRRIRLSVYSAPTDDVLVHCFKKPIPQVLVVESKGKQLKGSEDTNYKRDLARIFENIGQKVTWQELGEGFRDRTFRFQILDEGEYQDKDWHERLSTP